MRNQVEWDRRALDRGDATPRRSLALPIGFAVTAVVAAASVLFNVMAAALLSDRRALLSENAYQEQYVEQAESREAQLGGRAEAAEAQLAATDRELAAARLEIEQGRRRAETLERALADERVSPVMLPRASEADILRGIETFEIRIVLDDAARRTGLREGVVAEQARIAGQRHQMQTAAADADATLVLLVEGSTGTGSVLVRLAAVQPWRVPGSGTSFPVTLSDAAILRPWATEANVLDAVTAAVDHFGARYAAAQQRDD